MLECKSKMFKNECPFNQNKTKNECYFISVTLNKVSLSQGKKIIYNVLLQKNV